jgi:predicted metal-dependent enzyme (double-stranded beta helix superfamily)
MSPDNDSTRSIQKTRKTRLLHLGFLAGAMPADSSRWPDAKYGRPARTLESHNIQGTDREMVPREVAIPPGVVVPLHHHTVLGLSSLMRGSPNQPTLMIHASPIAPEKRCRIAV